MASDDLREMADQLDAEREYLRKFVAAVKRLLDRKLKEDETSVRAIVKDIEDGTWNESDDNETGHPGQTHE